MTRRRSLQPGVRRSLRLGAADPDHRPTSTSVHVAGAVIRLQDFSMRGFVQRCVRCGRILASVDVQDVYALSAGSRTEAELQGLLAKRFFAEGRELAEGPHATYLVSDRPRAADEKECEFVPAFDWE